MNETVRARIYRDPLTHNWHYIVYRPEIIGARNLVATGITSSWRRALDLVNSWLRIYTMGCVTRPA